MAKINDMKNFISYLYKKRDLTNDSLKKFVYGDILYVLLYCFSTKNELKIYIKNIIPIRHKAEANIYKEIVKDLERIYEKEFF